MFKNPLPSHDQRGPSTSGRNTDTTTNYTQAAYNYTLNHLYDVDEQVATLTIKDPNPTCNVVTHRSKITIRETPQGMTPLPKKYNLVEQLDKTPALISILELLHLSPSHKTILDQALHEATVTTNLNTDQFQDMVGSLRSSPCLTFSESDNSSFQQPHNASLHIEGFVNQHRIK